MQESGTQFRRCQARDLVWLFDDYLSRHRDQGNFQDDANVNGVFPHVCLQGFDQLYTDEDQEEVSENTFSKPWTAIRNRGGFMISWKINTPRWIIHDHDHDEHSCEGQDCGFLDLRHYHFDGHWKLSIRLKTLL